MKNNSLFSLIGLGFLVGCVSIFSPGTIFCLFLTITIVCLLRFNPNDERTFLVRIFIIGFIARVIMVLFINLVYAYLNKWIYFYEDMRAIALFGDSAFHTVRSWWLAQYFSGEHLNNLVLNSTFNPYGFNGYLYFMAAFYYLFGFSPISVTFVNCIASVLNGIIAYFICRELAGRIPARISALLIVFLPSLFLWSITNLKDTLFIFFTMLILWSFMKYANFKKKRYLILLILSFILQVSFRKFIFITTVIALSLSFMLAKNKKKYSIPLVILSLYIVILIAGADLRGYAFRLIAYHRGVISTGGFVYRMFSDWVYQYNPNLQQLSNFDILNGVVIGWFNFILGPFPWKVSPSFSIIAIIQMIIWWFIILFGMYGALHQIRYNWNKSVFLLVYFTLTGTILVLTGGNIGTDFRFRDMLTPIVILFASVGIYKAFYRNNKAYFIDKSGKV